MDIEKIKAALNPWADILERKGIPRFADGDTFLDESAIQLWISVGDLRRAAEAYAELEAAQGLIDKPVIEGGGVAEWRQAHDGLEPCPFCGTYAEVVHASHIRCGNIYNCDAETRLGPKAWNRRALVKEGVVERVAKAIYAAEHSAWRPLWADNWEDKEFDKFDKELAYKQARAAIAALLAPVSVQEQKT